MAVRQGAVWVQESVWSCGRGLFAEAVLCQSGRVDEVLCVCLGCLRGCFAVFVVITAVGDKPVWDGWRVWRCF